MRTSSRVIWSALSLLGLSLPSGGIEAALEGSGARISLGNPPAFLRAETIRLRRSSSIECFSVSAGIETPDGNLSISAPRAVVFPANIPPQARLSGGVRAEFLSAAESPPFRKASFASDSAVLESSRFEAEGNARLSLLADSAPPVSIEADRVRWSRKGPFLCLGSVRLSLFENPQEKTVLSSEKMEILRGSGTFTISFPFPVSGKRGDLSFESSGGRLVLVPARDLPQNRSWRPMSLALSEARLIGPDILLEAPHIQALPSPTAGSRPAPAFLTWEASGGARIIRGPVTVFSQRVRLERLSSRNARFLASPGRKQPETLIVLSGSSDDSMEISSRAPVEGSLSENAVEILLPDDRPIQLRKKGLVGNIAVRSGKLLLHPDGVAGFSSGPGTFRFSSPTGKHSAGFASAEGSIRRGSFRILLEGKTGPVHFTTEDPGGTASIEAPVIGVSPSSLSASGRKVTASVNTATIECRGFAAARENDLWEIEVQGPLRLEDTARSFRLYAAGMNAVLGKHREILKVSAHGNVRLILGDLEVEGERVVKNPQGHYTIVGAPVRVRRGGRTLEPAGQKVEYDADTGKIVIEGGELRVE